MHKCALRRSAWPMVSPVAKSARGGRGADAMPEVHFSDFDGVRCLHLGTEWVQGAMRMADPFALELEYVQRMMAWLLFVEPESVSTRHALQLGLGAGALTKFCHKRLRMRTSVVEINPRVLHACRGWFKLPPEDERLQIIIGDAAREVREPRWHGQIDALQVDLYDHEAAAPVLDAPEFYADCRALLTDEGCMTVNLFGRDASFERSVQSMAAAFGADALWAFKPTREGNTIVLAQRTPQRPGRERLEQRAQAIHTRWDLPAPKWLRVFRPLSVRGPDED